MNQVTKLRLMTALAAGGLSLTCLEGCSPASDHAPAEVNTDVAVQVASVCRTNLHAVITAFGLVEPEPAGGRSPGRTSPTGHSRPWCGAGGNRA